MSIINLDNFIDGKEYFYGKDGKLYFKQPNLLKEIGGIGLKMFIIWIGLIITHELGHISGAIMFNLKWEFFFNEPATYRNIDLGIGLGVFRDRSTILWEELYCRLFGSIILGLIWLFSLYKIKKSMFDMPPFIFWIPFILLLLWGDIAYLLSDIDHNSVTW